MRVFTNGCFDILHRGHVEVLKYCSSIACPAVGGYVVVGAIYCGIGMALLISSRVYWKTEREIPAEETP